MPRVCFFNILNRSLSRLPGLAAPASKRMKLNYSRKIAGVVIALLLLVATSGCGSETPDAVEDGWKQIEFLDGRLSIDIPNELECTRDNNRHGGPVFYLDCTNPIRSIGFTFPMFLQGHSESSWKNIPLSSRKKLINVPMNENEELNRFCEIPGMLNVRKLYEFKVDDHQLFVVYNMKNKVSTNIHTCTVIEDKFIRFASYSLNKKNSEWRRDVEYSLDSIKLNKH